MIVITGCSAIAIPVIIYCILIREMPKNNDPFHINWESKIHSKMLIFLAIACVVAVLFQIVYGYNGILLAMLLGPTVNLSIFGISFVSTFGIMLSCEASTATPTASTPSSSSNSSKEASLDRVLTNEKMINAFMHHLSSELSYISLSVCSCVYLVRHNKAQKFTHYIYTE